MNKTVITGICALALAATSCSDFTGQFGSGAGRIAPSIGVDTEAVGDKGAISRAEYSDISAADLSMSLTKLDGSYKHTWDAVGEFPLDQQFTVGDYLMEAFYGDPAVQGFECPAFYGSQSLSVADGQTTSLALTAQLANSFFTIKYTDAFTKYMQDWSASFATAAGTLEYPADESRPLYVAPGDVTLNVTVEKPNGLKAAFEVAKLTVQPRYNYVVTVDVNNGNVGDGTLSVSFSENIDVQEVVIDISDKVLSAPVPVATPAGFTPGEAVVTVTGSPADDTLSMDIAAMAGLKEVLLHTESTSLIAQGWPEEINLLAATPAQQATMTALGLETLGMWRNPDKMGILTFTNVSRFIKPSAGDNLNTFTVTVKDALSRVSEPVALVLNVEDILLDLEADGVRFFPGDDFNVKVVSNGSALDASDITFEYLNVAAGNKWRALTLLDIQPASRSLTTYNATVLAPQVTGQMTIRVRTSSKVSNEAVLLESHFALAAEAADVFATHAYLTAVATDEVEGFSMADATMYLKDSSGDFAEKDFSVEGNYFNISGLTPATEYTAYITANGAKSKKLTFTTEAADQLPNAGFEEWAPAQKGSSYWSIEFPEGWDTMNRLTTSQGSTSNGIASAAGYAAKSGTRQDSNKYPGSEGGYAAVVQTVGWGSGNTAWRNQIATGGGLIPNGGKCQNLTVGELYLGSYDADAKAPVYSGKDFTSRPAKLTFYAMYSPKNPADWGTAYVQLVAADGSEIAAKSWEITSTEYTAYTFDMPQNQGVKKAAKIFVTFRSSGNPACQTISNDNLSSPPSSQTMTSVGYEGSKLYIDDIVLTY
ncbi:MAG: DUF4493 domain-containing protein [Muribaculaceae bacterium]|nr:DUF4493 domain-containing protein [Muribaculaceae bacterium]